MTTRSLATGTLLLALTALAACGEDTDTGSAADPTSGGTPTTTSTSDEPTASGSASDPADPVAAPALATTPTLLQCLVQGGLLAGGPSDTELADGVVSERIWLTLSDGSELDPVTGALHVLDDEAQATTYAEQLLAAEVADEAVPAETATVSVHGNVVRVLESDVLPPPAFEQAMLGCLPGADPATLVDPPAPGTVNIASLMECAATVGMSAFGERSFFDVGEQRTGSVIFRSANDYGGYDELATVYVFPDAATAQARETATIGDQEARLFERRGNAIGRFLDTLDAADPTRATVLGCLPA